MDLNKSTKYTLVEDADDDSALRRPPKSSRSTFIILSLGILLLASLALNISSFWREKSSKQEALPESRWGKSSSSKRSDR